jgi:hypothetical protein
MPFLHVQDANTWSQPLLSHEPRRLKLMNVEVVFSIHRRASRYILYLGADLAQFNYRRRSKVQARQYIAAFRVA